MAAASASTLGLVQRDIGTRHGGPIGARPVPPSQLPDQAIRAEIAELAYLLWEEHGYPNGSAESDWLEAEHRIQERIKHKPIEL